VKPDRCLSPALALAMLMALAAACADTTPAAPPPEGASDAEVVAHVLSEPREPWLQLAPARVFAGSELADLDPDLAVQAEGGTVVAAGSTTFGLPDGGDQVRVDLLVTASWLDALAVFSAPRPEHPQRVSTATAAYWYDGRLHVYAGRNYLRLTPDLTGDPGMAVAQQFALSLELRLPARGTRPRIMRVMPRRWLNPFSLTWQLVGISEWTSASNALTADYSLGDGSLRVAVMDCRDEATARAQYTHLLTAVIEKRQALEVTGLGAEGFVSQTEAEVCVGMWQDEFLAIAYGPTSERDAEAIMRIVAMRVRTTRPLPFATRDG